MCNSKRSEEHAICGWGKIEILEELLQAVERDKMKNVKNGKSVVIDILSIINVTLLLTTFLIRA